jgi:transposase, IS5 family
MNTLSKQRTLAMTGFEPKKTRRAKFLDEMEQVVPWVELWRSSRTILRRATGGRPKELEQMPRIYFLQQWFNLADPAGCSE